MKARQILSALSPRAAFVLTCVLLANLLLTKPSPADVIHLQNGNIFEGELLDLGNGKVRIRLDYGSLTLSRSQIAQVETSRTPEEIARDAMAQLDAQDAEGRYELARWARAEQAFTLARRLLDEVLRVAPDHAGARRDLGYHRHEGRWLTEEELHVARGDVQFRGQWMRPAEREILLAEEARIVAERQERELEARARYAEEAARREEERRRQEEREAAYQSTVIASFAAPFTYYAPLAPYQPVAIPFGFSQPYQTLPGFRPGQIIVPSYSPYRFSLQNPHHGYAGALRRSQSHGFVGTSGFATRHAPGRFLRHR